MISVTVQGIKHGTQTAYKGNGCRCDDCRAANAASMRNWRANNLEHSKEYKREWDRALRKEVIEHYGGFCKCCGETELAFLALDHKNGGGTKHRQELGLRGAAMFAWAKREGFPDMFQVLCHNCNQAEGYYGQCPHEVEWQSLLQEDE